MGKKVADVLVDTLASQGVERNQHLRKQATFERFDQMKTGQ